MKKEKREIHTGGGTYVEGNININGRGKFINRDDNSQTGVSPEEAAKLFDRLFFYIERHSDLSPTEKVDIRQEVEEVREELSKTEQANENFILRRLRNIGRMAPDILQVALAVIANPAAGFGVIGIKIAEKIKTSAG